MSTQHAVADVGLWKRGLLLFGLVAGIAGVVLYVILSRPRPELPTEAVVVEPYASLVAAPLTGFPSLPNWAALYQLQRTLPSNQGWEVRYNATVALLRMGSAKAPFGTVCEMLDEAQQMRNFRETLPDGRNVPDEAAARQLILNTLRALQEWHKLSQDAAKVDRDNVDLQKVYAAIDHLLQSANPELQKRAKEARLTLKRG